MKRKPLVYFTTVMSGNTKLNLGIQVNLKREYLELTSEQFEECILNGYIRSAFAECHGDKSIILTLQPRVDKIEPQDDGTVKYSYELIGKSLPVTDPTSLITGMTACHDILGEIYDLSGNYSLQIRLPYGNVCEGDVRAYKLLKTIVGSKRIWLEDLK